MSTIANMWEATNLSDFLYRIDVWWTMWVAFDFSLFGCTACTPMWVMERPSFLKSKHMGACQNWISLWWSKKCVLIQTQIYSVKSGGCFFNPQQWYKLFSHMYLHSIIFFGEKKHLNSWATTCGDLSLLSIHRPLIKKQEHMEVS